MDIFIIACILLVTGLLVGLILKKRKANAAPPYFAPEEHWWEVSVILMDTYEWTPDMLLKYGMNDATLLKKAKERFDDKTFDVNLYPSEETLQQSIYTAQYPQDKQALLDKVRSKTLQESRELLQELDGWEGTRPIHIYDYYANILQKFKTNGTAKTVKILMPSSHYRKLMVPCTYISGVVPVMSVHEITYMMHGNAEYIQVTLQHLEQLLSSYDTSQKAARHTTRA